MLPERLTLPTPSPSFNPAILDYNGRRIVAWRYREYTSKLWIGELTPDYSVINAKRLRVPCIKWYRKESYEDPRFFVYDNSLWVAYTHAWQYRRKYVRSAQVIARLDDKLNVVERYIYNTPTSLPYQNMEKNWQFFVQGSDLYAVYAITPNHIVLSINKEKAEVAANTPSGIEWPYGEIRGGTPPILIDGVWHTLFHSSVLEADTGRLMYYAGLYTFKNELPFTITRVSASPCMTGNPEHGHYHKHVVFPCGIIPEGDQWLVSYGSNDEECRLTYLVYKELVKGLAG